MNKEETNAVAELIAKVEAALAEETESKEAQSRAFADMNQGTNDKLAEMEAKLEAAQTKAEVLERQLELQVVSQTMEEIHSFADGIVAGGKLAPAQKEAVITLLSVAANLEGDVKSFALGDAGEFADKTPFALVMDLLDSLPTQKQFNKTPRNGKAEASLEDAGRSDVRRYATDTSSAEEMDRQIKAIQKEKGLSYIQAFEAVKKEAIEAQG